LQGAGEPLLLIHGTGMNSDFWGPALAELSQQQRVLAYDRRGYSRSRAAPLRDYHTDAEDAAALLQGVALAPATVVGWSAGGIVALDLAINHPQLVKGLVLYEPPLHAKRHPDPGLLKTLLQVTVQRHLQGAPQAAVTFLRYTLSCGTGTNAWDQWPTAWQQTIRENGPATMGELDAGTGEHLSERQIAALTCPITCLGGACSPPFLRHALERLAVMLPQARQVRVARAGHSLHLDHTAEFVQSIQQLVARSVTTRG
jgi:pimeloyl-ACP methyl ester carboxylesterase